MSQEFIVRVPRETKKQFNVLHFNAALNIDVSKFTNCRMERETSLKEIKGEQDEELPEFGAGSEFGRKEREEARRRKFERRKNKHNNSPWILKVGGKQGKKYKGIREGGVTENTSYYVFFQAPDGAFEAFPVNEWYKFTPFQRYKALSAEEAEEKFNKRDQILNYFQLKHMGKKEGEGSTDEPKIKTERSIKKDFKVSDMDDWANSDNDNLSDDDSEEEDRKPNKNKLKGKKEKKEKKKKDDSDNDDEEPGEDSDEGDNDDKEVDYMSDLSSSSESESEKVDIKGVEDESALRDLVMTDDEEEEENKDQTGENNVDDKKVKLEADNNSLVDSELDSDNPDDIDTSKSALFIQNNKVAKPKENQRESTAIKNDSNPQGEENSSGLKQKYKLENPGPGPSHSNKRQKVDKTNELVDIITQDVKRYLLRKPHTAIELLKLCKNKVHKRDKLGEIMGIVLKNLNPEKRKDHNGKITFFLKH